MQYLVSVLFDGPTLATDEEQAAIDVFNEKLIADGHWVFAGGLGEPASATVSTTAAGGSRSSPTGPMSSRRSSSPGFWIIEADDLDVALKLAAEGSKACNRRVEVRPFLAPPE